MKPSSIGCNYGVAQSGLFFLAKEELNPNVLGTTSAIVTRGVAVSIYRWLTKVTSPGRQKNLGQSSCMSFL